MSFGLQLTAVLKVEEKSSKKVERALYLHGGREYRWERIKYGRRRREQRRGGVKGGLIVRKMNGKIGTGDTLGQTLMDSVPAGTAGNTSHQVLTWAELLQETVSSHRRAGVRTHTLSHTHTHLSHTLFTPHSVLPSSSLQSCNPAEGHKLNPISTWLSGNVSHFLSIIAPQSEREGRGKMKKDNKSLSIVSLHPKTSCSSPGSSSFLSCSTARIYLQGRGVHSILPEAGPHNPHKARPGALWAQEHKALLDPVLRRGLLMVVLHKELRGDVHTGCCLHREHLGVGVLLLGVGVLLLDSPVVMDILQPLTLQTRAESLAFSTCM